MEGDGLMDNIKKLERRILLLEEIVSDFSNIFLSTATPDQMEHMYLLNQWVKQQHEEINKDCQNDE